MTKIKQKKHKKNKNRTALRFLFLSIMILIVCLIAVSILDKKVYNKIIKFDHAPSNNTDKSNISTDKYIKPNDEKLNDFLNEYSGQEDLYKNLVVCIDAGHGGNDVGAQKANGQTEKNDTLRLALFTKEYLEAIGVKVIMTRTTDTYLSLDERKSIANSSNADILVSIHRNVYEGSEDINGIEAWINKSTPADALQLSDDILNNIVNEVPDLNNRGTKSGSMDNPNQSYIMNTVSMKSVLLEVGFISSEYDNKLFDDYTEDFAIGIIKGILDNAGK